MWLQPDFLSPVRIIGFYTEFLSLHANVSVSPSKCSYVYSEAGPVLARTLVDIRPSFIGARLKNKLNKFKRSIVQC